MKQCLEQQEPDVMRDILAERIQAGGTMAPDARAYELALGCLGKVRRVKKSVTCYCVVTVSWNNEASSRVLFY